MIKAQLSDLFHASTIHAVKNSKRVPDLSKIAVI